MRRALVLTLLLLALPGVAQRWLLWSYSLAPDTVEYAPTEQDMICGVALSGVASGAAQPVVVTGFNAAALGCSITAPPVVVWGDDGAGNTVYAVTLRYDWFGPYTYDDPIGGTQALADRLAQDYYLHLTYDALPVVAHWQRFDRQVTPDWDPSVPLPPDASWRSPPATDDYIEFGVPRVSNETNLSGLICLYLTQTSTCWYARFTYDLPVRLVILGDEGPVTETWTKSFGDPLLEQKTAVATLSLRPRSGASETEPTVKTGPLKLPPEIRRQLEALLPPHAR